MILTLTEFLLARIAADEAEIAEPEWATLPSDGWMGHAATWGRPRALAECEVKRRIVTTAALSWPRKGLLDKMIGPTIEQVHSDAMTDVLRLLALPYADHPDYRPEWKV